MQLSKVDTQQQGSTMHKISRGLLPLLFIVSSNGHTQDWFETYGNIGQFAIPGIALGISLLKDDMEGAKQLGYTWGSTALTTVALKYSLDTTRPNGKKHSMPSGHTSAAFSGAGYLHMRYGWEYGVPAYLAAAAVGWSRVEADAHYWRDVIVGAGIGIGFSYLFTERYTPKNMTIYPTVYNDGGVGIAMNYSF